MKDETWNTLYVASDFHKIVSSWELFFWCKWCGYSNILLKGGRNEFILQFYIKLIPSLEYLNVDYIFVEKQHTGCSKFQIFPEKGKIFLNLCSSFTLNSYHHENIWMLITFLSKNHIQGVPSLKFFQKNVWSF